MNNKNYEVFGKQQKQNIYNKYLITLVKGSLFNNKDLKNSCDYMDNNDCYKFLKKKI